MKAKIKLVLDALNDAFKRDPAAVEKLFRHREECNRQLADHPTVQAKESTIGRPPESFYSVSALGMLNGALEPLTGERIAIVITDKDDPQGAGKMLGFAVYKK